MSNPIIEIVEAAMATATTDLEAAQNIGAAVLGAAAHGLSITRDQKVVASVLAGTESASSLMEIAAKEKDSIVAKMEGLMLREAPEIKHNGKVYRWKDAKGDTATLLWYLAAAGAAGGANLREKMMAASVVQGLDVYGQDPLTILLIISAVVGILVGVVTLAKTAYPVVKEAITSIGNMIHPPPPVGGGSSTDATSSATDHGKYILIMGAALLLLASGD